MTNERHEKALEAAVKKWFTGFDIDPQDMPEDTLCMGKAIAAYLQAMDAVIVPKEPVAWRSRFNGVPSRKWTVQKNKPDWYKPSMPGVDLEPLFAPVPNHFTNGE